MPSFPCPNCGAERSDEAGDCSACGWKRREPGNHTGSSASGRPCLFCGGTNFAWGYLSSGQGQSKFKYDDATFLDAITGRGHESLSARRCNTCGNVQFFVQ